MMSSYSHTLPMVFPYVAFVTPEQAREAITALMQDEREDVPQGSSFALTVDGYVTGYTGYWKLWLSAASYYFLEDCVKQGMWKKTLREGMLQKVSVTPPYDDL